MFSLFLEASHVPTVIYISKCSAFQTQVAVQHITGLQSLSFETLSFLLTVLAATVTPVFVLSQHWLHLPCGCIINCRRSSYAVSSQDAKGKGGRVALVSRGFQAFPGHLLGIF